PGPSNSGGLPPIPAPPAVLGVLEGNSLAQALAALPDPNQAGRLRLDGDPIDRIASRDGTATTDKVTFTHDNPAELASLQYDARAAGGDPLPSWVQFDPTNQTVSASPDANVAPGVYQFVVVARDSQGNEARAEVTIRVPTPEGTLPTGDTPAPAIVLPPGQGTSVPGAPDAGALEARIDLAPPPIAQPSLTSQLAKAAAAGEIAEILNLIGELVEHDREAA
ncbi:MAG: putative Ig domain-containing protein, partial [Alphaproteobacteria bacterium]|nr:putative Ig domain-containing protein [Alphaproteobacteria bacterium]